MPWWSPPALQYVARFNPPALRPQTPHGYGFAEPRRNPDWHPGGGMQLGGSYHPGSGRYHHHRRSSREYDHGGGRWFNGQWYPGGGHYETNPGYACAACGAVDCPCGCEGDPSLCVCGVAQRNPSDHYGRQYRLNPADHYGQQYQLNPGCKETKLSGGRGYALDCWYTNPPLEGEEPWGVYPEWDPLWGGSPPQADRRGLSRDEAEAYARARSGMKHLGLRSVARPERSGGRPLHPVHGYDDPAQGRGHSDDYMRGVAAEQEDWDDPSWGAAYGDAGYNPCHGEQHDPLAITMGEAPRSEPRVHGPEAPKRAPRRKAAPKASTKKKVKKNKSPRKAPPAASRCSVKLKSGTRCKGWKKSGKNKCSLHEAGVVGGSKKKSKKKGRKAK